ncbi:head-tail joining protein [Polaromonas sp.]|uniref:head-tail joining protein n=1 Tax=Polaromonas sp. TaxID=1869339 RepID=UPI003BB6FB30
MQTFEDHGMATRAIRASAPAGPGFIVGFMRPEQLILGDSVHTAQIEIEYATVDAPSLALGEMLTIGAKQYRVHNVPRKQGDGTFTRAELEEARA